MSRAVEKQPCFDRDIISDLSDQATTSLLELTAWTEGEKVQYEPSTRLNEHVVAGQLIGTEDSDADSQLLQAAIAGNATVLKELITRLQGSVDARGRFTRAFLAAISEAPFSSLELLLETGLVDIQAEDDINGRNCLHEASISGREVILERAIAQGVDASRMDAYGRLPLHYACMHGQVPMVRALLQCDPDNINSIDHDHFTPLIHSIIHHHFECVRQLLEHGARIEPETNSDHIPLNFACQYGSTHIIQLLLEKGAQIRDDAEGLYPQHLVARNGISPEVLLLLQKFNARLDQQDKLYQWTPLFHAVSEGHVRCVKILLEQGVEVNILDEKDLTPMYYAAWEGHLECMGLLIRAGSNHEKLGPTNSIASQAVSNVQLTEPTKVDPDGIPDLSLPPPIIPLRRYGHNFLDNKAFVQISFGAIGSDAITFYSDSKYPAARLTITSKSSDLIPRNLMLPIQEEFRHVSFQVDNLDLFSVDFDIFPTFGSKMIARTIALPSIFTASTSSSGRCCLPLLDPRLRAIGHIDIRFQVIKPFKGIPLEISHFETYWKATSQLNAYPSTFITGSSLSGDYVQLPVQLTADCVPVVYHQWCIEHHGLQIPVGRLPSLTLLSLIDDGTRMMLESRLSDPSVSAGEVHETLLMAPMTLETVLETLPSRIHVDVHVLYPNPADEVGLGLGPSLNINNFADVLLTEVFEHSRILREHKFDIRSLIFSSYNADVCTALNWKQPNCKKSRLNPLPLEVTVAIDPVLLCNDIGANRDVSDPSVASVVPWDGRYSLSVKEAVRIAQSNNFMGLVCTKNILVRILHYLYVDPLCENRLTKL